MKPLRKSGEPSSLIPKSIWRLYDALPLVAGPISEDYQRLMLEVINDIQPQDVIEGTWCRDVADLVWEAQLLRLVRAELLGNGSDACSEPASLGELLDLADHATAARLVTDQVGDRDRQASPVAPSRMSTRARPKTQRNRGKAWADFACSSATCFEMHGLEIERISRMITQADSRRDAVIGQIEKRRARRSNLLPRAAANVD
jgi:hypothetical protein